LHQEDCDLSARPWELSDSNAAPGKKRLTAIKPFRICFSGRHHRSQTLWRAVRSYSAGDRTFLLFAYLLSMGFKPVNLLPDALYPAVSKIEKLTMPALAQICGAARLPGP